MTGPPLLIERAYSIDDRTLNSDVTYLLYCAMLCCAVL